MDINDYISAIDTKRFGFPIAKFENPAEPVADILEMLRQQNVKLVIARAECQDLNQINDLEQNGFVLKDIQTTYRYETKYFTGKKIAPDPEIILRDARSSDLPQLESIARESFQNYGHYAADSRLDNHLCNEIYVDWTRRCLLEAGVADKFFVAELDGSVQGYMSFKINDGPDGPYAACGLGAVAGQYRNRSLYKAISQESIAWAKRENLSWVEHNILITNYPVNKSLSGQGYKIYRSFVTMHKWL